MSIHKVKKEVSRERFERNEAWSDAFTSIFMERDSNASSQPTFPSTDPCIPPQTPTKNARWDKIKHTEGGEERDKNGESEEGRGLRKKPERGGGTGVTNCDLLSHSHLAPQLLFY